MADEKAEEIIQKIRKLQELVRSYDEAPQRKQKRLPKKAQTPKKVRNSNSTKKFSEAKITDDLFDIGSSLLARGKKVRHIHNNNLNRHYLDLWISLLLKKLMEKQKIDGGLQEKNANKIEYNTDELINDPVVKEAEKIVQELDL